MTPYTILEASQATPFLLVCDHASAALPDEFGENILPPEDAARHISHDIGAAAVTRLLASTLPAHAFLATLSRLVVDLNRSAECPDVIPEISDGSIVPFNQNLSAPERTARLQTYHEPYHHALGKLAQSHIAQHGQQTLGILVHSFTPCLKTCTQMQRPWHIGLLWRDDEKTARQLQRWLESHTDFVIGDNEPYTAFSGASYTMRKHFGDADIPHIAIELRQDLIADRAGQENMATLLAQAFKALRA